MTIRSAIIGSGKIARDDRFAAIVAAGEIDLAPKPLRIVSDAFEQDKPVGRTT